MLLVIVAVAGILLPVLWAREPIFMFVGRDATLTGRAELWDFIDGMMALRALVGYCYGALFGMQNVVDQLISMLGWVAPNAHDGYRNIILGLGTLGLISTEVTLGSALWQAVRTTASDPHRIASRFAFLFLTIYLFRNLGESDLLAQSDLSWIVAAIAVLLPTAEGQRLKFGPASLGQPVLKAMP